MLKSSWRKDHGRCRTTAVRCPNGNRDSTSATARGDQAASTAEKARAPCRSRSRRKSRGRRPASAERRQVFRFSCFMRSLGQAHPAPGSSIGQAMKWVRGDAGCRGIRFKEGVVPKHVLGAGSMESPEGQIDRQSFSNAARGRLNWSEQQRAHAGWTKGRNRPSTDWKGSGQACAPALPRCVAALRARRFESSKNTCKSPSLGRSYLPEQASVKFAIQGEIGSSSRRTG